MLIFLYLIPHTCHLSHSAFRPLSKDQDAEAEDFCNPKDKLKTLAKSVAASASEALQSNVPERKVEEPEPSAQAPAAEAPAPEAPQDVSMPPPAKEAVEAPQDVSMPAPAKEAVAAVQDTPVTAVEETAPVTAVQDTVPVTAVQDAVRDTAAVLPPAEPVDSKVTQSQWHLARPQARKDQHDLILMELAKLTNHAIIKMKKSQSHTVNDNHARDPGLLETWHRRLDFDRASCFEALSFRWELGHVQHHSANWLHITNI